MSDKTNKTCESSVDKVLSDLTKFVPVEHPVLSRMLSKLPGEDSDGVSSISLSDLLPSSPSGHVSFMDRIGQAMGEYFTALTVGAAIGAAVTAGLGLGLVATSNIISTGKYLPTLYKWAFGSKKGAYHSANEDSETNPIDMHKENNVAAIGAGDAQIVILRGCVQRIHLPVSSAVEQCHECLNHIGTLLSKQNLAWSNVRRITAYITTGGCHAKTFRQVLKEYPISHETVIVSVLFVSRLEQPHALVQLEVLASKIFHTT